MADDSDDVPPLEDMSELIHQVDKLREMKTKKLATSGEIVSNKDNCSAQKTLHQAGDTKYTCTHTETKERDKGFGGLKKGFLLGGASKPKQPTTEKKATDHIPLIKPKDVSAQESKLHIPEVQEAMKTQQNLMKNNEWISDDLLTKVVDNRDILKKLQDPGFMQAIGEFQTDPDKALAKYHNNPEVMGFFKQACNLLGTHFTDLADTQDSPQTTAHNVAVTTQDAPGCDMKVRSSTNPRQPTAGDEQRMSEILSRAEVREALEDTVIQQLIACLKSNPDKAQSMLQTGDAAFHRRVQVLVQNGLLSVQR